MKSTMKLTVDGNSVSGDYVSADSGEGHQATGKIKGYVQGNLISFVVLWDGGSMTAWTGELIDDPQSPPLRIATLWHLVTDVPSAQKLWTSTLAGADDFTRPRG